MYLLVVRLVYFPHYCRGTVSLAGPIPRQEARVIKQQRCLWQLAGVFKNRDPKFVFSMVGLVKFIKQLQNPPILLDTRDVSDSETS